MEADDLPAFGDLLRGARRATGLTHEELAERSGLSVRGISDLERGVVRAPRRDTLDLLADALDLAPHERNHWEQARRRLATRSVSPSSKQTPSLKANLPAPLTTLVGREQEIADVARLFRRDEIRLVTLTGPGGVGKTRVAIAAAQVIAEQIADRGGFVDLSSIQDPELVLSTIAQALRVRETAGKSLLETLKVRLQDRQFLLVLDNFEQVVAAAPVLSELLSACPQLRLLVTSRVRLRLRGEQEYPLGPLVVPVPGTTSERLSQYAAAALFIQRVQEVKPDFQVTNENAPAVVAICGRLDGLPLAIELTAARAKLLTPPAMLARLERPLAFLTGGARDAPVRQQTIRNTIAWSYELLNADEQQLMRQLSVFVGGWTLDAAVNVVDNGTLPEVAVLDGVSSLVDKSLIVPVATSPTPIVMSGGDMSEQRFTMLETIREFALDELVRSGEEESVRRAYANYFRTLAERAETALRRTGQMAWIERVESELPNLRAVLDWSLAGGDVETSLRLAGALYWFWFIRSHVSEGRDWFERVGAAGRTPAAAAAKAAIGASLLAWRAGEYAASKAFSEEALELFMACGDRWGVALVTHQLGHLAQDLEHDLERAITLLSESVEQFQAIGDAWGVAFSQRCLGWIWLAANDYDRATSLLQPALATFRQVGDDWCVATTLHFLGDVAMGQKQWANGIRVFQESLTHHWPQRNVIGVTDALLRLAQILVAVEDMEQAARFFGCVEAQREHTGVMLFERHRLGFEQAIATARAALGEGQFKMAWEAGRSLSLSEAVEAAIGIRLDAEIGRSAPRAPAVAAGLSKRELEVLRLVAKGYSNREIADTLFITAKTAENHVGHILTKLDLSSRTQAAVFAVEQGLVESSQD